MKRRPFACLAIVLLLCGCSIFGSEPATTTEASTTSTTTTTTSTTTTTTSTTTTTTSFAGKIACYMNSDCGFAGREILDTYACSENRIYLQYIVYRCEEPGTPQAQCVGKTRPEIVKVCNIEDERCVEGTPYCRSIKKIWGLGRKCEGTLGCVVLNGSEVGEYKTGKSRYEFKMNYAVSDPLGIHISVKKPDGVTVDRYLIYPFVEKIGDFYVSLAYASMPERYAEVKVATTYTVTTLPITIPYVNECVPEDAEVLEDIDSDDFDTYYKGFGFRIDKIFYLDTYSLSSLTLEAMGPDREITKTTCVPDEVCGSDGFEWGVCWDERFNEPIVWIRTDSASAVVVKEGGMPDGAYVMANLNNESDVVYGGFGFRIADVSYAGDRIENMTLEVRRPNGPINIVSLTESTSNRVNGLVLGLFWDNETNKSLVWILKS